MSVVTIFFAGQRQWRMADETVDNVACGKRNGVTIEETRRR